MFDTANLVYTPPGSRLVYDDIHRWERFEFDVLHYGVRMRTSAFDVLSDRMRSALETMLANPRHTPEKENLEGAVARFLAGLAPVTGGLSEEIHGSLRDILHSEHGAWWLRLTDHPAETFFAEDYEARLVTQARSRPHFLFGNVRVNALDGLEVEFPGDDEGLPFSLDIPTADGATRAPMPATEPLALVEEFCGVNGVSARGRTINITAKAEIPESHEFCAPLGTVQDGLYATLYVHVRTETPQRVLAAVKRRQMAACLSILEKSHFKLANEGRRFRIFEREGDVIHLYDGLEGHEAEGTPVMPPFILVAQSGGESDPVLRSELLEATLSAVNAG